MVRKHYKNEGIIKLLVVLGGIIGFLTAFFSLFSLAYIPSYWNPHWYSGYWIIYSVIGMIVGIFTILCGMRKQSKKGGEILPFHWLTFLILAILIIIFNGGLIACILLIIAFLIALIEDL
ncbi:MAG: hypothetical protein ACTSVV_16820 [Promethearchaeota archaeon]